MAGEARLIGMHAHEDGAALPGVNRRMKMFICDGLCWQAALLCTTLIRVIVLPRWG